MHLLSRRQLPEKLVDIKESFSRHSQSIEVWKCLVHCQGSMVVWETVDTMSTNKVNGKRLVSKWYYGLKQAMHMYMHKHTQTYTHSLPSLFLSLEFYLWTLSKGSWQYHYCHRNKQYEKETILYLTFISIYTYYI